MDLPAYVLESPNPYQAAIPFFDAIPPEGPSAGFRSRLIVLGTVLASLPVLTAALLCCHIVGARRRGEAVWAFRCVRREAGSYIVGNRTILLCTTAMATAVVFGVTELYAWRFVHHMGVGMIKFLACLMTFWTAFFLSTVCFAFSNFQSWLVVTQKLGPRTANLIFLGTLFFGTTGLLVAGVWGGLTVARGLTQYEPLMIRLHLQAFFYNGLPLTDAEVAELKATFRAVSILQDKFYTILSDLLLGCAFAPVTVLLLNVAGIALVLTVRRQARGVRELVGRDQVAAGFGSNAPAMKAAEQALLVDSCLLVFWSLGLMAVSFSGSHHLRKFRFSIPDQRWPGFEALNFSVLWVAAVPFAIAMCLQTIIAFRNLPERRAHLSSDPGIMLPSFVCSTANAEPASAGVTTGKTGASKENWIAGETEAQTSTTRETGPKEVELGEDQHLEPAQKGV